MKIVGIIPARMASTRLPGKPMIKIRGLPMIGHVYFRSKMSESLDGLYVATCDEEIFDYIKGIGGRAIMTSSEHSRATERTAEALEEIEKERNEILEVAVMIQGDEPMVFPEMIDSALRPFMVETGFQVVNLMTLVGAEKKAYDPNEVKVVIDQAGYALYFSRQLIPSLEKTRADIAVYKQVCVVPFWRDFLVNFVDLESTPLEKIESIDMLRVLEHGYRVKMVETKYNTRSVDSEDDLVKVEELMAEDPLLPHYIN